LLNRSRITRAYRALESNDLLAKASRRMEQ
jgi:hypothetical protein